MSGSAESRIRDGDPVRPLQNLATRLRPGNVQLAWKVNTKDHPTSVLYQVVDGDQQVWGSSPNSREAMRAAERNILRKLPAWKRTLSVWNWTLDEVRRTALVIPVPPCQAHPHEAKTGAGKKLLQALHELRSDLREMHQSLPSQDATPVDDVLLDKWASASLAGLLSRDMASADCTYMDGGVRPWIFAKEAALARGVDVVRVTHRMEIESAMARGEEVAGDVLADHPELTPEKPVTHSRMRA